MNVDRRVAPPSGAPAPMEVATSDGVADLRQLAQQVCGRYYREFTDEDERYGDAGRAWCVHDNQYLLHWALLDLEGITRLQRQVSWLAGVLEARGFPLDRLARDLDLAADVVEEAGRSWSQDAADRLRAAGDMVRSAETFL